MDTTKERARAAGQSGWCKSSLWYAGHDHLRPREGDRETRLQRQERHDLVEHANGFGKTASLAKLTEVFQFHFQ